MSATGVPRDAIASRKFFMSPRIAGATWRSRSYGLNLIETRSGALGRCLRQYAQLAKPSARR